MANRKISELTETQTITRDDLFVAVASGITRKITGDTLEKFINADKTLNSLSASWNDNFTVTSESSANWNNAYTEVSEASANWNNSYTTTSETSANWENTYTVVAEGSAHWNELYDIGLIETHTIVSSNSAIWNEASSIISAISGELNHISETSNLIASNSANWEGAYSTVAENSANWNTAYVDIENGVNQWTNTSILVDQGIATWNDTYNTVSSLSSVWSEGLSGMSAYLSLTGGTIQGSLHVSNIISANSSDVKINVVTSNDHIFFNDSYNNKVVHFDTISKSLCAVFPEELSPGFNVALMNTGTNDLVLSAIQINSIGTTITTRYGGAFVYKESNSLFAVGGLV